MLLCELVWLRNIVIERAVNRGTQSHMLGKQVGNLCNMNGSTRSISGWWNGAHERFIYISTYIDALHIHILEYKHGIDTNRVFSVHKTMNKQTNVFAWYIFFPCRMYVYSSFSNYRSGSFAQFSNILWIIDVFPIDFWFVIFILHGMFLRKMFIITIKTIKFIYRNFIIGRNVKKYCSACDKECNKTNEL